MSRRRNPDGVLKVSVGDLVAFALRTGDLHYRGFGGPQALEGIYGHQRLQRSRPEGYRAEIPVHTVYVAEDLKLEIGGRIDGVFTNREPLMVEEIKTTRREAAEIPENKRAMHEGQAKVYAYLLALNEKLERVAVQLTYYHLDTGKVTETRSVFPFSELETFFIQVVSSYLAWARTLLDWRALRDASIVGLDFPHRGYRKGQRAFAVAVYRAIKGKSNLLAQAPTGTGKTMATLFPAVKALGEGRFEKLFFLTAKTMGARAAQAAFAEMEKKGLRLKSLTLTAKDKICFNAPCDPETCEYAMGYYDRLKGALAELFESDAMTRETVEAVASRHRVCPFELSLDMAPYVEAIVCDFNYAFDPGAYLRRFFGEKEPAKVLLVDEAHNLVDRARDMYSAVLRKREILSLKNQLKVSAPPLAKRIGSVNRAFLQCRKETFENEERERVAQAVPAKLRHTLQTLCAEVETWLAEHSLAELPKALTDLYFEVRRFLRTAELFNAAFVTIYRRDADDLEVKLYCLDPAELLRGVLDQCRAAIFFSATLNPFPYFSRLLTGETGQPSFSLPSPFPPENFLLAVADRVSTLYRNREATLDAVVEIIHATISAKPGNYLAYFPSYQYLRLAYRRFRELYSATETAIQDPNMDDGARAKFLAGFSGSGGEPLLGFAVMGGVFGEAIDLTGERLIGVIVVGVGLPGLCLELDLVGDYFAAHGFPGFAYAYRIPGMNRVLQTAGRVIRGETDRGVVCLVDTRFREPRYRQLFPAEWRPAFVLNSQELDSLLRQFWQGH